MDSVKSTNVNRVEKAEALFKSGCNCSQAVFAAFADEFGLDEELAKKVSCGLGGGVGRMRETCGAVTGAALVIGMRKGPEKTAAYPDVQAFCRQFKAETGSIVCRELLEGTGATQGGAPEARTEAYYRKRPCVELVKLAASLLTGLACGCWTFNESQFPAVAATRAPDGAAKATLTVAGFETALTEYETAYGYTTVYVPGYCGYRHYHPGYYETVSTRTLVPTLRTTDMFLERAKDQFEAAGFRLAPVGSDRTVEVRFAGPYPRSSDAGWSAAWMLSTVFFCDYAGTEWTAKLKIRDSKTGDLLFTHDYTQRFETHVFGLIPLFSISSCDRTTTSFMQSWCLAALTDRAVADATAFLAK